MAEILTHIAFYAGWPNAWAAFRMAKEVYADDSAVESHGGFFGLGEPNDAYAQHFTGRSFLKPLTVPGETVFLANVTFEPGCRNNWHIHHAKSNSGQLLICVDGEGWYQEEGKPAMSSTGTVRRPTAGSAISPLRFPARTAATSGASLSATQSITRCKI